MKKYSRIFNYLKNYKGKIALYFLCIILSIVFAIASFGMLSPFFDLIFNQDKSGFNKTDNPLMESLRNFIFGQVGNMTPVAALALICIIIVITILLKNIFLYFSFVILNPLKNKIVNDLRAEIYNKILQLPIGYFTEKRKGDLISRFTNDVGEVEGSLIGALEGWIRDPLTIIFNFAVLFFISPQLTFFLIFFIPVVGFIIGRITRSLKAQSTEVAHKYADSVSVLDETLTGLRVIKAFNVENMPSQLVRYMCEVSFFSIQLFCQCYGLVQGKM